MIGEKRKRCTAWLIVERELQSVWTKKFRDGKKKWHLHDEKSTKTEDKSTKTEGECTAIITVEDGTEYVGKYELNKYHAEMAAWVECEKAKKQDQIISIKISSPPCHRCAVVLEMLGLSDKVHCKNAPSRDCATANWPWKERKKLVEIVTPFSSNITETELKAYEDNIYSHFQATRLG